MRDQGLPQHLLVDRKTWSSWIDYRNIWHACHPKAKCRKCRAKKVDLHHLRYPAVEFKDVMPLCRSCHDRVHVKLKELGLTVAETEIALLKMMTPEELRRRAEKKKRKKEKQRRKRCRAEKRREGRKEHRLFLKSQRRKWLEEYWLQKEKVESLGLEPEEKARRLIGLNSLVTRILTASSGEVLRC